MKPAAATRNIPKPKGMARVCDELTGSIGVADAERADATRACNSRAVSPTTALNTAANLTQPDSPRKRIRNSAAAKQAIAEPKVFTAYRTPTDSPTLFVRSTK